MSLWVVALAAGLLTFLVRLSFISLPSEWNLPPLAQRAMHFVPPAVLSAIVFPELLLSNGALDVSGGNERLVAGLIAIVVTWRSRKIMPTLAAGMVTLWLLQYLNR